VSNTHPPIANKVACIDFDGTIVPWGPLMAPKDPFPGVPEAIRNLAAAGYSIVIFTSRLSSSWLLDEFGKDRFGERTQVDYITDILDRAGIPFHAITSDKIPAEVYFDDKAIRVSEFHPLDIAIKTFIKYHAS